MTKTKNETKHTEAIEERKKEHHLLNIPKRMKWKCSTHEIKERNIKCCTKIKSY